MRQWSRINALIDFRKLTFEQLSTRSHLPFKVQVHVRYCIECTVPCIVHLSVHFNPYISKNYRNLVNYVRLMTLRPCTVFVRNCTTMQYVTIAYRDISSQQTTISLIFVKFEIRPFWLYLPFEITEAWCRYAFCYSPNVG